MSRRVGITARALALLALIFSTGLTTIAVSAHANYVSSTPENGAVLPSAPTFLTIEFSEPLDMNFSHVRLVDRFANVLAPGPGRIDPTNPHILILDLPALGQGTYTAIWLAASATDKHNTAGSVVFSVGKPSPEVSLLPPVGQPLPSASLPAWPDVVLRLALYLASALLGGALSFGLLVWRPAFRSLPGADPREDELALVAIRRQAAAGAGLLVLVTLVQGVLQALAPGSSGSQAGFGFLANLSESWWFWLRLALGIVLGAAIYALPAPGRGRAAAWAGLLLGVLGVLASLSLTSHSAANGDPLPVVLDLVHLAAMTAWFGGLPALFVVLRRGRLPAAILVPFFTRLALTCVTALALTGLYSGLAHITSLDELFGTTYGKALVVKVALFGLLFGLGGVNLLVITPRLKQAALPAGGTDRPEARSGRSWLNLTVRFEMALGVLLLAAVGVLSSTPPASAAVQADRRLGFVGSYQDQGVTLALWMSPGRAGDNEVAVDLSGLPTGSEAAQVLVRFANTQHNMGQAEVKATSKDGRRFTVRGSYLSMAGDWTIEVVLTAPSLDGELDHLFPVSVLADLNESSVPNPVPASPQSIASGQAIYAQKCTLCHGPNGKGDGPASQAFNPRPADLSVHGIPGMHTDGQLFLWISQGIPGSAMAGFSSQLSETERWDVVNFIHTLAKSP